jgi:hypothetical protein
MRRNSKSFPPRGRPNPKGSVETRSTIDGRDVSEFTDEELVEIYLSQPHPDELARQADIELLKEKTARSLEWRFAHARRIHEKRDAFVKKTTGRFLSELSEEEKTRWTQVAREVIKDDDPA